MGKHTSEEDVPEVVEAPGLTVTDSRAAGEVFIGDLTGPDADRWRPGSPSTARTAASRVALLGEAGPQLRRRGRHTLAGGTGRPTTARASSPAPTSSPPTATGKSPDGCGWTRRGSTATVIRTMVTEHRHVREPPRRVHFFTFHERVVAKRAFPRQFKVEERKPAWQGQQSHVQTYESRSRRAQAPSAGQPASRPAAGPSEAPYPAQGSPARAAGARTRASGAGRPGGAAGFH